MGKLYPDMKTTERIHALLSLKILQLRVIDGMNPKEAFDLVILRTKLRDEAERIHREFLND